MLFQAKQFFIKNFFPGGTVVGPRSFLQSGPIFLDKLMCSEDDKTLQECGIREIGLTSCDHAYDVWVQCYGRLSHNIKSA